MLYKPKKCHHICHYRATGFLNPPDVHCEDCPDGKPNYTKTTIGNLDPVIAVNARKGAIRTLDDYFSDYIRLKGNWTCIKCHRQYLPYVRSKNKFGQTQMTNSHYFKRGKYGTRWEEDNCDPMCWECHVKIENHKHETIEGFNYETYMLLKLGHKRFNNLQMKAEFIADYSLSDLSKMIKDCKMKRRILIEKLGYGQD